MDTDFHVWQLWRDRLEFSKIGGRDSSQGNLEAEMGRD